MRQHYLSVLQTVSHQHQNWKQFVSTWETVCFHPGNNLFPLSLLFTYVAPDALSPTRKKGKRKK